MQILGILVAGAVVYIGFLDRESSVISYLDWHAMTIILLGTFGAIVLGSGARNLWRTFTNLREFLPFRGGYSAGSRLIEEERQAFESLWLAGKKTEAMAVVDKSDLATTQLIAQATLENASPLAIDAQFTNLSQKEVDAIHPSACNWELMGRLAPSFGMVGTLTGMIQLFKNFGSANTQIGAGLSLALLATLYGITFGAAIFGPIGHYLANLLEERLAILEKCEKTTQRIASMSRR